MAEAEALRGFSIFAFEWSGDFRPTPHPPEARPLDALAAVTPPTPMLAPPSQGALLGTGEPAAIVARGTAAQTDELPLRLRCSQAVRLGLHETPQTAPQREPDSDFPPRFCFTWLRSTEEKIGDRSEDAHLSCGLLASRIPLASLARFADSVMRKPAVASLLRPRGYTTGGARSLLAYGFEPSSVFPVPLNRIWLEFFHPMDHLAARG